MTVASKLASSFLNRNFLRVGRPASDAWGDTAAGRKAISITTEFHLKPNEVEAVDALSFLGCEVHPKKEKPGKSGDSMENEGP